MMRRFLLLTLSLFAAALGSPARAQLPATGLFSRSNLVAWCIVPFDTAKRTPAQRAAMLESLGIRRLAYDWRNEHIPTFDAEVAELSKRRIEITAWWFPAGLGPEARAILDCLNRHHLSPQLWVTLGTEPEPDPTQLARKIDAAAQTLAPVCAEAAKLGSTVGLYNHLGWFGEPTNQLAVLARLRAAGHTNAGIVYNFHHGHAHLDRFAEFLPAIRPHLLAVNLNGMVRDGDQHGQKIIPVGSGTEEVRLLRILARSGWWGPIGILGHTEEDAELKLRKELAGLEKIAPLLAPSTSASPAFPAPTPTPAPAPAPASEPGSARAANRDEPWKQVENDWVDDRWNLTTQGRWQAYTLPTPTGTVRRGLAVSLGEPALAHVVYDTASGNWRAAWDGPRLLNFNAARFGLIQPPQPASPPWLTLEEGAAWSGGDFAWRAFHVAGQRLVLEYSVGPVVIRESPWAIAHGSGNLASRDLEIPAFSTGTLRLVVLPAGPGQPVQGELSHVPWFGRERDGRVDLAWLGAHPGATLGRTDAGRVELILAPHPEPRRLRLIYHHGPRTDLDQLAKAPDAFGPAPDLAELCRTGTAPARAPLSVKGQLSRAADAYLVDTIPVPYDNPDHALIFASGVGFFANGDAAVCTLHGDVWRVTGLTGDFGNVQWLRVATGLYQPLGLTMVDDQVVVLCRDQLVRLVDRNGDGFTDSYEALSTLIETSSGGHDYVTSLCRDDAGNFYYVDPRGAHRISPDGKTKTTIARGFRNANGMSVSPDGRVILVAPQQGEWTPSSVIHELVPEGWYGFPGPKTTPDRPLGYDLPLCWIPHRIDNSSGSQVWVTSDRFGPLSRQLVHLSWGRCTLLLALRDVVDGTPQGAVVPLKPRLLSGPMRAAVHPRDGQLYVVGCQGWQTAAARDGSFQRVRWTGKKLAVPTAWRAVPGGLRLTFNEALDPATAADPGSYAIEAWNYRYAAQYGSKDWSVKDPSREGHDPWNVASARLEPDGHTLVLAVPDLRPVMQFSLRFNLDLAGGGRTAGELYGTIHRVASH